MPAEQTRRRQKPATAPSGSPELAGAVFAALADPTRRDVVTLLSEQGAMTTTQLGEILPVTRQAVAKHIATLKQAALVESSRNGRETYWHLTPEPFDAAALWMAAVGAEWDRRLDALRRHLGGER